MNLKTKQTLSVILAMGSAVGTVVTVLLARRAALKEKDVVGDLGGKTFGEKMKLLTPVYAPTAVAGAVTIASIIGSNVMSHKAQASIMSMAVLADQGWRRYKNEVKSTLGIDKHSKVLQGIANKGLNSRVKKTVDKADTRELYFEEHVGYFRANKEDVAYAYAELNEILNMFSMSPPDDDPDNPIGKRLNGYWMGYSGAVTFAMFFERAKAEFDEGTHATKDMLNSWGWSVEYMDDQYPWSWIHMETSIEGGTILTDGEEPVIVIEWKEEPILLDYGRTDKTEML